MFCKSIDFFPFASKTIGFHLCLTCELLLLFYSAVPPSTRYQFCSNLYVMFISYDQIDWISSLFFSCFFCSISLRCKHIYLDFITINDHMEIYPANNKKNHRDKEEEEEETLQLYNNLKEKCENA